MWLEGTNPELYQNLVDKCTAERSRQLAQSSELAERRREGPMQFAVGMIVTIKIKTTVYHGVIVAWDSTCAKDFESRESKNNLRRGLKQPFYAVHHSGSNFSAYIAEGDLLDEQK